MKRYIIASVFIVLLSAIGAVAQEVATKIDEFGAVNEEQEMARLDNFAIEIQNRPDTTGYVIVYAGRKSKPGETAAATKRIVNYLVKRRGFKAASIKAINGGYREDPSRELFLVPAAGAAPVATPTVDASEIPKPKKKPIRRPAVKKKP